MGGDKPWEALDEVVTTAVWVRPTPWHPRPGSYCGPDKRKCGRFPEDNRPAPNLFWGPHIRDGFLNRIFTGDP